MILSLASSFVFFFVCSTVPSLFAVRLNFHLIMLGCFSVIQNALGDNTAISLLYDFFAVCVCLSTFSMARFVYQSSIEAEVKVVGLGFSAFLLSIALTCLGLRSSVGSHMIDMANALWQLSLAIYVLSITTLHHTAIYGED